jgi:hypothetical protein
MNDEDIKRYSDSIANKNDPFSSWAHNHLICSIREWDEVMHDYTTSSCYCDDIYHEVGVNLDYYWLLECRDEVELLALLQSWFSKENGEDSM